ncbi:MAG: Unknown protein, partial [uncultured Sulfurovum sp.]
GNDFIMADGTSTNVSAGNFNSRSGANTTLQIVDVSGTMDVDAIKELLLSAAITVGLDTNMHGENITQDGEMTIGGALTLNADANMNQNANTTVTGGDMTVTAGNDFIMAAGTSTNVSARNFNSIVEGDTTLQMMDVSGSMEVDSDEDVVLAGALNVTGDTGLNGLNISQDGEMIVGGSSTIAAGENFSQNANTSSVGDMNVTAGNNFIMSEGTSTTVSAGKLLADAKGDTTLQAMNISESMNVTTANEMILNNTVQSGLETILTATNVSQEAKLSVGGVLDIKVSNDFTQNAEQDVSKTLTINAGNNITQNANTLTVNDIRMTAGNDFIMSEGTSTTVKEGNFSSTSEGLSTLNTMLISNGSLAVDANKALLLNGAITAGLDTNMHGENITQNADISIGGALTLSADSNINQNANTSVMGGSMRVTAANDFLMAEGTSTNVSAGDFNSTSGSYTTLQTVNVSGSMNVNAGKSLLLSGTITAGLSTSMQAENITQNADMNIRGRLTLNADANINQNANTSVMGGDMSVRAGNDFIMGDGSSTNVSAGNFNSNSGGNTSLEQMTVSGSMNVNSKGDLLLNQFVEVGGSLIIKAGGSIIQNQNIDVEGDITYEADDNIIMDAETETVSNVGNIDYTASGAVFISNLITHGNTVSLNVSNVNSVLDSNNNEDSNINASEFHLTVNSFDDDNNAIEITENRGIQVAVTSTSLNSLASDEENLVFNSDENVLVIDNEVFSFEEAESAIAVYIFATLESSLELTSQNLSGFYEELEESDKNLVESISLDTEEGLVLNGVNEELDLDDLFGKQQFMEDNFETFYKQLSFLYDSGMPLFDLYASEEYENSTIINSNIEYWIEDIAI